jgi:glucosyl-3-phosphoglycerate synthase
MSGKGEALWKSLAATSGDLIVFIDADLREFSSSYVTGLLGPLLTDPSVLLVKGFYDRVDELRERPGTEGGRVTELVARPLLNLRWPELSRVVQPLAGEWAARRTLMASLPVPVAYGVELSTLLDTAGRHGLDAVAQVDLGRRAHRHQAVHDLGMMATELLAVEARRLGGRTQDSRTAVTTLAQFDRSSVPPWRIREVPVGERPPADTVAPDGRDTVAPPQAERT